MPNVHYLHQIADFLPGEVVHSWIEVEEVLYLEEVVAVLVA